MFSHLLVPLDGSPQAEAALPAAAYLAGVLHAEVTLVHVVEQNAPENVHGQRHLTTAEEARDYLTEIIGRAFAADVNIDTHVHTARQGDVARGIVAYVRELGADLIIMATHGRRRLRAWLFGTIAEQVIGVGQTPALVVRPMESRAGPQFTCGRFLVPIDGDPAHEQVLPVASDLAHACQADLHLLMVVYTLGTLRPPRRAVATLLPGTTQALLDMTEGEAKDYLADRVERMQGQGLSATAEVRRGDVATAVVRAAHRGNVDLVVLGTHGKSGTAAFWSGSVAPQVASRTHLPVLLVPVGKPASKR